MTTRAYFAATIKEFLEADDAFVLGQLVHSSAFDVETTQRDAWLETIRILKSVLTHYARRGKLYLEYSVPRLGKRIDAVMVVDHVVFVIEFKVGDALLSGGAGIDVGQAVARFGGSAGRRNVAGNGQSISHRDYA